MMRDPVIWCVAIVAGALLLASGLLIRRELGRGRLLALLALQWLAGGALLLFLFPPHIGIGAERLVVVTSPVDALPEGRAVSLPEAGRVTGATPVPDLATALRQGPAPGAAEIVGAGLVARDRIALPVPARFDPPPQPAGIIALSLPEPSAPGVPFTLGGQASGVDGGAAELHDPAGAVVARARVAGDGGFTLAASAPAPGAVLFQLVLRDRAGGVVERLAVPVEIREPTLPRMLVLAGAPSAEVRQLRRFAEDAGIEATVRIDLGAGLQTGDAPVAIERAALSRIDLLVIDDRRWERLGAGERSAIQSALAGGMGLLLRPTGPLSAETRRGWAALGMAVSGGEASLPVQHDGDVPPLARRDVTAPGAIAMLRDDAGNMLAAWRPHGRGRVGLWSVTDSYALVLAGAPERYSTLWSTIFSTLVREGEAPPPRLARLARAGERAVVCGLGGDARIFAPDGSEGRLLVDPAAGPGGCAAFWPLAEGWHVVREGEEREAALYVHAADAAPAIAAAERREATMALAASATGPGVGEQSAPGPRWPWLLALLALLGGLWWLERRRPGEAGEA